MIECFHSRREAPGSIPSSAKQNKAKQKLSAMRPNTTESNMQLRMAKAEALELVRRQHSLIDPFQWASLSV
jgi:hypothetical protein